VTARTAAFSIFARTVHVGRFPNLRKKEGNELDTSYFLAITNIELVRMHIKLCYYKAIASYLVRELLKHSSHNIN